MKVLHPIQVCAASLVRSKSLRTSRPPVAEAAGEPSDTGISRSASGLRTILLAEDTPSVRMTSEMVLDKIGMFSVIACEDGDEAVLHARQSTPDLIMLDWMMPRLGGRETLAALRKDPKTRFIPVVVVTARAEQHERAEMIRLGAAAVIEKPFDPIALPDRLRSVWAEAI